jgi:hypothetical protein
MVLNVLVKYFKNIKNAAGRYNKIMFLVFLRNLLCVKMRKKCSSVAAESVDVMTVISLNIIYVRVLFAVYRASSAIDQSINANVNSIYCLLSLDFESLFNTIINSVIFAMSPANGSSA